MPNLVLPWRRPAAGFILLSTFLLLLFLWGGLAACQPTSPVPLADPTASIPYLERVIQIPRGHAGPAKGELHPDGRLYFINYLSSVGVIEGSRLVKLIDPPWLEGVTARHLRDLAIHPATGLVYVVERYEGVVHVIQDLDVVATVPVGGRFPKYITVDPVSPYLYATSGVGPSEASTKTVVTVISGTEVVAHIPLGYQPYSQFYNPVEQATYIGYYGKHIGEPMDDPPQNGVLAVIKGTEIITRTQLGYPENRNVNDMAVNARTGEMYFIESDTSLIYRSPTGELSRLRLKTLGYGTLRDVVVDAKRGWAYVGTWGTPSQVLVIEKDQILAELPVAEDPLALAVDETHDYVYVASRLANVFTVIRGTEVITAMRHDGIGSSQIVVDEPKGYIYVLNPDYGGSVSIFRVGVAQPPPPFWETFLPWVQGR